jgi:hypothetical protein
LTISLALRSIGETGYPVPAKPIKGAIEMIGRRVVGGLVLLSALMICALAAQSASAAKSVNTTVSTCVPEPSSLGDFDDEHCDKSNPGKGKFTHSLIPLDTTTEIDATNESATNETKDSEPAVLKSKVAGAKVTIECSAVKSNPEKTVVHNIQTEVEKVIKHTVTGEASAEYSSCNVKELSKCVVTEPIMAQATFEGAEKLGPGKSEMGLEFLQKEGKPFAEITFGGAECAVKSKTFNVTGSAIGTSGPTTESSQTNEWSGSTLMFTPKSKMQKLKLGPENAEFTSIATPEMASECGGNAISATTVT